MLQNPKLVLRSHHAGLNIFKSSFENIFDQIESFLGLSTKVENSAKEFLLLISDGWNSVVSDIKGTVCGFPTGDGEVAALTRLEPHPHAGDAALDGVDDLSVPSEIGGDQTEVICVG